MTGGGVVVPVTVTAVLPEALVEPELAAKEMVSDPAEAPAV